MNLPTAILIAAFAAVAIIVIVWSLRDGLAPNAMVDTTDTKASIISALARLC